MKYKFFKYSLLLIKKIKNELIYVVNIYFNIFIIIKKCLCI